MFDYFVKLRINPVLDLCPCDYDMQTSPKCLFCFSHAHLNISEKICLLQNKEFLAS